MALSPATSPSTSVSISLSLLDCLLYQIRSPCRLGGFIALPPSAPTWLPDSHLQEGHFLSAPAKMWVRQRRSWEKQINTSSFQLGLEIRAQRRRLRHSQALCRFTLPGPSTLAFLENLFGALEMLQRAMSGGLFLLEGHCTKDPFSCRICRDRPEEQKCDRSVLAEVGGLEGHLALQHRRGN